MAAWFGLGFNSKRSDEALGVLALTIIAYRPQPDSTISISWDGVGSVFGQGRGFGRGQLPLRGTGRSLHQIKSSARSSAQSSAFQFDLVNKLRLQHLMPTQGASSGNHGGRWGGDSGYAEPSRPKYHGGSSLSQCGAGPFDFNQEHVSRTDLSTSGM